MAKSVNKVILVGNVGQDPEVRYTPSGVPVARVSLATNERFKDGNDQWQDRTEWHTIVAWQRLAEIVGEYVRKGTKLYIEGKLQTTSWQDRQSGEKKYRTEIVARDLACSAPAGTGRTPQRRLPTTDRTRSLPPRWLTITFLSRTQDICGNLSILAEPRIGTGALRVLLTPIPTRCAPVPALSEFSFRDFNAPGTSRRKTCSLNSCLCSKTESSCLRSPELARK